MSIITRFAPSPTGFLHLGHIYAALCAQKIAHKYHGKMLLRMEDIDTARCRDIFARQIIDDMAFLNINYDGGILYQSQRFDAYQKAFDQLHDMDLLYPCFCTRKTLKNHQNAMNIDAPHHDESIHIYPQYCRDISIHIAQQKMQQQPFAWRLKMDKAIILAQQKQSNFHLFTDWSDHDEQDIVIDISPVIWGDIIIARKDIPCSYHLAVVVDDAFQQVNFITRSKDLQNATPIHRLVQTLLGYSKPNYWHHDIICNDDGHRLAKRHNSLAIKKLRDEGRTRIEILTLLEDYKKLGSGS